MKSKNTENTERTMTVVRAYTDGQNYEYTTLCEIYVIHMYVVIVFDK